jgi:cell division septal protein FtsQ
LRRFRVLIAVLAAFVLLAWVLGWSSLLTVRTIHVQGIASNSSLKASQLIAESGLRIGDKMARAHASNLEQVKRKYPKIESIDVKRSWPSTITITNEFITFWRQQASLNTLLLQMVVEQDSKAMCIYTCLKQPANALVSQHMSRAYSQRHRQ